jgi:hypothetical protein
MEPAEFDMLAEPLRRRSASSAASYGFALIEGLTVTAEQIAAAEQTLGVTLPGKYKTFMTRYGGGTFGFADLLPIAADTRDDICSINRGEFPDASFIAIAPAGTGDFWGFPVTDRLCHDQVWFHYHDAGDPEPVASDFLEFVARHALQP